MTYRPDKDAEIAALKGQLARPITEDAQMLLAVKNAEIAALRTKVRDLVLGETSLINRDMDRCAEIARLKCEVESWYSQNQQHIQDAVDFAAERDVLQQDATCYHWLQRATQTQVMQVFDLAETDVHLTRIILDAIARETGK